MTSTLIPTDETLDDAELALETNPMRAMLTPYERPGRSIKTRRCDSHVSEPGPEDRERQILQ